ncbi:sigma factor-like helix-turn-helix DNA-binding protein [Actinoplanes sp. NPDC049599]|uniref:sigma factor-like helix-turn-helix DNA-binding protein n=1 Tax=Actinoplanes sp. NPDC049599 TaxID=3363903 RepID=UPI0037B4BFA1
MLQDLPAQHRAIIVATYFRHRTTREAALQLGVTPGAVQALLYEAMRELSLMVAAWHPTASEGPSAQHLQVQ